jgi:hypothetical protein
MKQWEDPELIRVWARREKIDVNESVIIKEWGS